MYFHETAGFTLGVAGLVRTLEAPFDQVVSIADLAVGAAAVTVATPAAANTRRVARLTNISTGGQLIRIGWGATPSFPSTGELLNPGDTTEQEFGALPADVEAIADAGGGTLNRVVLASTP